MFGEEGVDYLAVGHICHDLVPGGRTVGGAAAYAASVARVLGCRPGVLTSAAAEDDWQHAFPEFVVHQHPANATTVFENVYTSAGRIQTLHAVAAPLTADLVPEAWQRSPIVHLAPIANEVDPAIIHLFSNSLIGVGPQGWMRRWDDDGRVYQVPWGAAADVLPLAAAAFVSLEDLASPGALDEYRRLANVLVVTAGADGAVVYYHGEERRLAAPRVRVVDTTGAGDIYAAAYLVRLYQTDGDVWDAGEFANRVAAASVTQSGLADKMAAIQHLVAGSLHPAAPGGRDGRGG